MFHTAFSLPALLFLISVFGASAILLFAAVSDVRRLTISNKLSLLLVALFPLYAYAAPFPLSVWAHLGTALVVLAVTFTLFAARIIGGGDAKLVAALSLWMGPHALLPMALAITLAGGVLALFCMGRLFMRRYILKTATAQDAFWAKAPVPYGVAIACGGMICLLTQVHQYII